MNVAFLDSLGPLSFITFGMILLVGSNLMRKLIVSKPSAAESPLDSGVQILVRSKKVVSIDRRARATRTVADNSLRRAGNYR
ncbi:MAG TPA: hypothetical protein VML19_02710 [Verrucomicrobiae bacterium]|nr:hypothetical protein [Verrucomicrobiae bacterium]